MSYFATCLREIIDASGRPQSDIAGAAGIAPAMLSRYAADKSDPTLQSLEQICAALPEDERIRLVIARIRDCIPESAYPCIRIHAVNESSRTQEDAAGYIAGLPRSTREALDYLTAECRRSPSMRHALEAFTRVLRD